MIARSRLVGALGLALVVGLAGACEGFLFNKSGAITVSNLSSTETAVLAIIADDVKSYPTLGPGATAVVTTAVGGDYQVVVVMSAVDAQTYRNNLQTLKQNVSKVIDGTASTDEKVLYFTYLAQINSAIAQASTTGGAGCSGSIELNDESAEGVLVTVNWIPTLGSGSWQVSCGST